MQWSYDKRRIQFVNCNFDKDMMQKAKLAMSLKFWYVRRVTIIFAFSIRRFFEMVRRLCKKTFWFTHNLDSKTMSILCILPRRSGLKNSLTTFLLDMEDT